MKKWATPIQANLLFSSTKTNKDLAQQLQTSPQTVSKWRNRDFTADASCRPKRIVYALTETERALAISIRKSSWFPLYEFPTVGLLRKFSAKPPNFLTMT